MLVDPHVSRQEVLAVTKGLTPAKLLAVAKTLNIVEIMMGMQKMRARRTPAVQGHCTSARDNPLQVVCDAAEASIRGFAEVETTLGIVRYAPLVAMAQRQVGVELFGKRLDRGRNWARGSGAHAAVLPCWFRYCAEASMPRSISPAANFSIWPPTPKILTSTSHSIDRRQALSPSGRTRIV